MDVKSFKGTLFGHPPLKLLQLTGIALDVLECELNLVLSRDVLPGGEKHLLLHVAVLAEEDMDGNDAGEVEDVDVVLDCNLPRAKG